MFKVRRVKPSAEDGWFGDEDSQEWSPYMAGACILLYVSRHRNARLVNMTLVSVLLARLDRSAQCKEL
jgi:hypothetical protein